MRDYLRLLRVHQYSKNVFILFPLFFAGEITDAGRVVSGLLALAAFSAAASAIYIINDCRDAPFDREHPRKMNRPIASGRISVARALWMATGLLLAGLAGMYALGTGALMFLLAYLGINVAYTLGLKHITFAMAAYPDEKFESPERVLDWVEDQLR